MDCQSGSGARGSMIRLHCIDGDERRADLALPQVIDRVAREMTSTLRLVPDEKEANRLRSDRSVSFTPTLPNACNVSMSKAVAD